MKNILIIGATSSIASECSRLWASEKASFFLVGRNIEKLDNIAKDILVRGALKVKVFEMDFTNTENHQVMLTECLKFIDELDIALIAHGTLPNQKSCELNAELLLSEFSINTLSTIGLLTILANYFENKGSGAIGVITSVAGDRGRPSNYVYGSSKAAISVFCDGMRVRLFNAGVSLTDIRPGFVETPMTANLIFPKLLVSKPSQIAKRIITGIEKHKDILYTPVYWRLIMFCIRSIPKSIFRYLKI